MLIDVLREVGVDSISTAISDEGAFRRMLEKARPKVAIEIGTYQGASTALLAQYCDKVYTFDTDVMNIRGLVWNMLGVQDKIIPITIHSSQEKYRLINEIDHDFAFIDGNHMDESVCFDFVCVQRCGNVLFHDYWGQNKDAWPDVVEFVDRLNGDVIKDIPFALWKKK